MSITALDAHGIVSVDRVSGIITLDFDAMLDMSPERRLRTMIAVGKYHWANPNITAEHFPIEERVIKIFRPKLFDFGRHISSDDAVTAIKKEKFDPATHVHGLAYSATFPDEQRKYPAACLGSSARVDRLRQVVCLFGRNLDLNYWGVVWYGNWRFLGVQEVSDS
jgi:hypothetical protein